MKTRLTLVMAAAVVLLLACAAPAPARAERGDADAVPYGWLLQLRGVKNQAMSSTAFRTWTKKKFVQRTVVDDNKTPDDPSDDVSYSGVALWRLVGRIDDKDPATFSVKRATTGAGYNVVVEAVDGFSAVFTSAEVATLKNKLVVANRADGVPLSLGAASIKNAGEPDQYAAWKPTWPLKLVSSDGSIFGNRKPAGVVRISIVPATGSTAGAPPSGQAAGETSTAGAKAASDDPPGGGWTLTLQGSLKRVLKIAKFPAKVAWDGRKAGNINPSLRYVYKGQSLYKLLALVDDKRPGSFNLAKAKKGYTIQFICRDGYKPKIKSRQVLKNGTPRKTWIVAKLKAGKRLEGKEAPFRFVGGPPITQPFNNELSAYGVIKIRLIF